MTLVRSSPVTVTVPGAPLLPACTSTFVITPSNNGCGVPLRVMISMMRNGGVAGPLFIAPAMMKNVFNSDLLLN